MSSIAYYTRMLSLPNVQAALKTIRKSEGTYTPDKDGHLTNEGYRVMFGGKLFDDFSKHPNRPANYTNKAGKKIITTAAGAYQIIHPTWVAITKKVPLPDFSPTSQDVAALSLLDGKDILQKVADGLLFEPEVMDKANDEWASLPGSGNHQPEHSLATVKKWYLDFGGTIGDPNADNKNA